MLILPRVCVDFQDKKGNVIFSVKPENRLMFMEAPDEIQNDPLFQMLVNEGSLEAGITKTQKRALENDPTFGHEASGKTIEPEEFSNQNKEEEKVEIAAEAAKPSGRGRSKTEK